MMGKHTCTAGLSAFLVMIGGASFAQGIEFSGAEIGVSHSQFSDVSEASNTSFEGSMEFGLAQKIGVQIDVATYSFGISPSDVSNVTLHGLYHITDAFSAGLFVSRDDYNGDQNDFYGFELAYDFGATDVEFYGSSESESDAYIYGLDAQYTFANGLSLGARYASMDLGSALSASTFAARAGYALSDTVQGVVELGSADMEVLRTDVSEPFFAVGVEFSFGPSGGTTFGKRSFGNVLAGF